MDNNRQSSQIKQQTSSNFQNQELQDYNINQILDALDTSFAQNTFSQKYKDLNIEKEFEKYSYGEALYFGRAFAVKQTIIYIIYMAFQVYRLILLKGNYPSFKWAILISLAQLFIIWTYILVMKRYKLLFRYFTDIITLVVFLVFIELSIMGNPTSAQVDGYVVIPAQMTFLSMVSYSQRSLLLSYVICIAYLWIRSYNWINDDFRYARFNIYFTCVYTFIYFFSRAFHSRERKRFQQGQQQQKLLSLFNNLIRVYHDGILITQADKIVFKNKQIDEIFQQNNQDIYNCKDGVQTEYDAEEGQALKPKSKEEGLIHELQKAKPASQLNFQSSISLNEDDNPWTKFENIWEYIIYHKFFIQDFISGVIKDNPLDGIYFRYHNNQIAQDDRGNEPSKKRLQVFTQVLSLGSQNLILTTIRDMSNWLELEKQKNLSEMKTIAFASAAHEFRNPLNGIVSSLALLDNQFKIEEANPRIQRNSNRIIECLSTAKNCSKLMLHLVNDILDFSQLESKTLIVNLGQTSLSQIVNECISVMIVKAQSKGIDLFAELNEATTLKFYTDKNRMTQILVNLLSNAIKYTNQGYVKIIANISQTEECLFIHIIDTGVGIEEDKIPLLFTPFTKILTNRNKCNQEGVGLGLTISKNIAEALGGSLYVKSEVGVGTTFTLMLPLENKLEEDDLQMIFVQKNLNASQSQSSRSYNFYIQEESKECPEVLDTREITKKISNFQQTVSSDLQIILHDRNHIPQLNDIRIQIDDQELELNVPSSKQTSYDSFSSNHQGQRMQAKSCSSKMSQAQSEILDSKSLQLCTCSKILIVDDEHFNLFALQGLLDQLNQIAVDQAHNGEEAIKMVKQNRKLKCLNHKPYQMVFLDKQMPLMNGLQTAIEIRRIEDEDKNEYQMKEEEQSVLILITGDENAIKNDDYTHYQGKRLFDDVLLKPIDVNNLQLLLMRYQIIQ